MTDSEPMVGSPYSQATIVASEPGYTRLSGSGLSMTDWRLEGRRLPWTQEAWVKEFEEYKKYPEPLGRCWQLFDCLFFFIFFPIPGR